MRMSVVDGNGKKPLLQMSFMQARQAAAIMDCLGRLIPQEGVDYDVEIVFKGAHDPGVSMNISALTDKGEWWRQYVMKMINKYPPTAENPEPSIPADMGMAAEEKDEGKENDEEIVS